MLDNPRTTSTRARDKDPDSKIGIVLPLKGSNNGFFRQSSTLLEQTVSNMKNLLLTVKGERVAQPTFGCNLFNCLFENFDADFDNKIIESIREAVATWLPHVVLNNIQVDSQQDKNTVSVSVAFSLATAPNATESLTLNLLRAVR